jgi:hypothetical protein
MSISYQVNDSNVYGQQLAVQEISIPFTITANATAASKSSTIEAPAVLFLNLLGVNNVTTASGALPSGATLPTTYNAGTSLPATVDGATSVFYAYVKLNQYVKKVVSCIIQSRVVATATGGFSVIGVIPDAISGATMTVPTPGGISVPVPQGVSSDGQGCYILFSNSNFNLSTTNVDATLTLRCELYS